LNKQLIFHLLSILTEEYNKTFDLWYFARDFLQVNWNSLSLKVRKILNQKITEAGIPLFHKFDIPLYMRARNSQSNVQVGTNTS
jgi:hypothetical protein